jgi:hypothetical protein
VVIDHSIAAMMLAGESLDSLWFNTVAPVK